MDIFALVLSIIALLTAIWSSWQTTRSASSAGEAVDHAKRVYGDSLARELAKTASRITQIVHELDDTLEALKKAYRSGGVFAGQPNSSRVQALIEEADKIAEPAETARKVAKNAWPSETSTGSSKKGEMMDQITKAVGALAEVEAAKFKLQSRLARIEAQNSELRD